MKYFFLFFATLLLCSAFSVGAWAAPKEIRLKYEYQHFIIPNPAQFVKNTTVTRTVVSDDAFCLAADAEKNDSPSIEQTIHRSVDFFAIEKYLEQKIAPQINQPKNDVRIFRNEKGNIAFEGYAQKGITLDVPSTAQLIAFAIENNLALVNAEVQEQEPTVTVEDETLKQLGIQELVAVGRSDFTGSSGSRVHNIMTGANKFNGYLIPKDSVFSFTSRLGAVNGTTGYVKELVILGQKVVPDYGGGLCQVSSTAYRGAMLAGMEILERHNHSYAVRYYEPAGSDATIYVGSKDFKFKNTSEGALLLQTRKGGKNNQELFFHYYGTKPKRSVYIYGPVYKNYRSPPAAKTTISADLAPGTTQVVSQPVTGFDAVFYRDVIENEKLLYTDKFTSLYQARGLWTLVGAADTPVEVSLEVSE